MIFLSFSFLDRKYTFWVDLVQKFKIFILSWNSVPRLIWICEIQCWCSFFFIFDAKYPFGGNLVKKFKIVSLSWTFAPTIMFIMFWDFLMVEQIFHSPQVKRSVLISNKLVNCQFKLKGATKFYFMYYSRVVIILFSTGLYKSAFSTCSFGKTSFSSFCVLVFHVSVSLAFNF